MEDIFKDKGNPNDTALGNDFLDLDDPNGNGDFSEQEKTVASDGYNQEKGNIDVETQRDSIDNDIDTDTQWAGFSDFDTASDDDLDASMFPTGDEIQEQGKTPPVVKKEETSNTQIDEDQEFLNTVNKKFKTNFKTEKEFNDFMTKTNEQEAQQENVITDKEQQSYDVNKGNIQYLDKLIQKDDEALMREHEIIRFFQQNQKKPEGEDLELIEEKIERMKDNMLLSLTADNFRNKYSQQKNELESFNNKIDEKIQQARTSTQKQKQQQLMNSYKDIYVKNEGKFMGVDLTTQDLQATYNDVKSGDFVKRILEDPNLAASLSLMERKLKEIQEVTSQPGYSDGINAILKQNTQGKRMGSNTRASQPSGSKVANSKDEAFLQ